MEEKIKNNKKLIISMVFIFVLLLLIGGTYAAFRYTFLGANNLINTESIELEFLESSGEIIDIPSAFPMIDSAGIAQDETFDFQVKTKTGRNIDITYQLYLEKLTPDTGYTFLNDGEVKVYLTDFYNNAKVAPVKISELNSYILYTETNSHNSENIEQKDKYKLRIWVDEGVTAKTWDADTKLQYKFKIGIRTVEDTSSGDSGSSTSNAVYSRSTSSISLGASKDSISGYTTDYTTLGENFFLKHNIGSNNTVESQEVCYILNGTMYCLKGGDEGASFEENEATLLASFGENNCYVDSGYIDCSESGLLAIAEGSGRVTVTDSHIECDVFDYGGNAYCGSAPE